MTPVECALKRALQTRLIDKLHATVGLCNHCRRRACPGRKKGTTLPDSIPTTAILNAIDEIFGADK